MEEPLNLLKARVEKTIGREMKTPRDFDFLATRIYSLTNTFSISFFLITWIIQKRSLKNSKCLPSFYSSKTTIRQNIRNIQTRQLHERQKPLDRILNTPSKSFKPHPPKPITEKMMTTRKINIKSSIVSMLKVNQIEMVATSKRTKYKESKPR